MYGVMIKTGIYSILRVRSGALANDIGFLPTASYCGRLRGDFLNMTAVICGSRLGRGLVKPGGVQFDVPDEMIADLVSCLDRAEDPLVEALDQFFSTGSVMGRLQSTGTVTLESCLDLGFVGPTARATGWSRDVRLDHPHGWLQQSTIQVSVAESGDVFARALVRKLEIERSIEFVKTGLQALP